MASSSIIPSILDPLGGIHFVSLYSRYYPLIDFLIYLILFTGLARATLEKRFEGIPGRLLSLGVGIVLALALAITEYRMNFNIASFGPMAVLILMAVVGLIFFQFLLTFGIPWHISASVSFISLYTTVRAFAPSLFDWMLIQVPFLAGLFSLALLVAMGIVIYAILPRFNPNTPGSAVYQCVPETIPRVRENARYSERAETASQTLQIEEQDTFKQLQKIKQLLPSLLPTDSGQAQLLGAVQDINLKEHSCFERFKQLRALNHAIEKGDIESLQSISREVQLGKIPPEKLSLVLKGMDEYRLRTELEKSIATLEGKLEDAYQKFSTFLRILSQCIQNRDRNGAIKAIAQTQGVEQNLKKIVEVIALLEKKLKSRFLQALKSSGGSNNKTRPSSQSSSNPGGENS